MDKENVMATAEAMEGGCTCRAVRYRLSSSPLFVHCCHCRWCQRETGSAFALNALIETSHVEQLSGIVEVIDTPSQSGKGQKVARCSHCKVAVWSHYAGAGNAIRFVRVGTLDAPDRCPPDIHIFASSKQPWVTLSGATAVVAEYYRASDHWPTASLERRAALRASEQSR